jgi:hypothetical protein
LRLDWCNVYVVLFFYYQYILYDVQEFLAYRYWKDLERLERAFVGVSESEKGYAKRIRDRS